DRIRAFHVLRFLARRCQVHLACLADEPVQESSILALRKLCARLTIAHLGPGVRRVRALTALVTGKSASEGAFASPALLASIRAWSRETHFHSALASSSSMAPYLRVPALAQVPA